MLTNYHTHSTFCDGINTPEQMVLSAIEKGFSVLGFSGHGFTDFDLRYCMKDTEGYIAEIRRLKEKYEGKIEILLGIEEDMHCFVERERYDYIIGSSHYSFLGDKFFDIDGSPEATTKGVEAWGNPLAYAEDYFKTFCDYIKRRKPDVVGHFDLLTKFDDVRGGGFGAMPEYRALAKKYAAAAAKADCIFEINTGAISRGWCKAPYPSRDILEVLKAADAKIMLNSDCHHADALDCNFAESKAMLRDIGFKELYYLSGGKWQSCAI